MVLLGHGTGRLNMSRRRNIGRGSAAAAALLLCASAALAQGTAIQEKPAAVVNGEAIAMADVRAVLDSRPSPVPLTAAQQRDLRQAALDVLVDDLLMRQFLRKSATPAQPAEIQKEIGDLGEVLKKKTMTLEQFLREG